MNSVALEPSEVWKHFFALCAIPRLSQREAGARDYVIERATAHATPYAVDNYGNVIVSVPGSVDAPPVAVQAHLDMVAAAAAGVDHNWRSDPIAVQVDGDRVTASGTSLGADNGIGAAMALALLSGSRRIKRPLELIFTVEEEIGLRGAANLDASLVRSRRMINLDSEEIDKLTIGCTGGAAFEIALPLSLEAGSGLAALQIAVTDGLGGHSGIEIHKRRANAIKLVAQLLGGLERQGIDLRIAALSGGSAANAIPAAATATITTPSGQLIAAKEALEAAAAALLAEWKNDEPALSISVREIESPQSSADRDTTRRILSLFDSLPHGVQKWSDAYAGKVETSSNVAVIGVDGEMLHLATSARSFLADALSEAEKNVRAAAKSVGGELRLVSSYPGWEPRGDSELLKAARECYNAVYGKEPEIDVVHAGLECGAIIGKISDMDAVSFGPDIHGAHTAAESVTISTVQSTWRLLTALLDKLDAQ